MTCFVNCGREVKLTSKIPVKIGIKNQHAQFLSFSPTCASWPFYHGPFLLLFVPYVMGSSRSENENEYEYEFVCIVFVRMRSCPCHVTQVGNFCQPLVDNEILRKSRLHENEICKCDFCTSYSSRRLLLCVHYCGRNGRNANISLKTRRKITRIKEVQLVVFNLK